MYVTRKERWIVSFHFHKAIFIVEVWDCQLNKKNYLLKLLLLLLVVVVLVYVLLCFKWKKNTIYFVKHDKLSFYPPVSQTRLKLQTKM